MRPDRRLLGIAAAALVTGGCGGDGVSPTSTGTTPLAVFSPDDGELPLPNDLLFAESGDGTLNPPDPDDPDEQALVDALSGLDGWSTVAPIRLPFSQPLDAASLTLGDSVRMFEVTLDTAQAFVGAPVASALRELDASEVELSLSEDGYGVIVTPLVPLRPSSAFTVVVTRALLGTQGDPVAPSVALDLALLGEPVGPSSELFDLQTRLNAELEALAPFGVSRDELVVSTTFSTQSIDSVQHALVAIAAGAEAEFVAQLQIDSPFLDFSDPLSGPAPAASVGIEGTVEIPLPDGVPFWLATFHRGWVELPYYLDAAPELADLNDDETPLSSRFRARFPFGFDDDERHTTRFNPLPAVMSMQRVPLLVAEPLNVPKPKTGWPVVVFQHGITGDRSNLLGLASSLGLARVAAVAIDLPLHGITDDEDPLFAGFDSGADGVRERHFGLDLLTESEDGDTEDGNDGEADSSGAHFIQLASVPTTRDNVKQAVADLLQLTSLLDEIDLDGDGQGDFDTNQVYFVGHSLGAVTGAQFLPFAEGIRSATLGMPGGGLVGLLVESPSFSERILDGLAEQGVFPGTDAFTSFTDIAQSVTDSADPINHALALREKDLAIHLIEVVGETDPVTGEVISLPDQTIPPSVEGYPLSGTDPLIDALELPTVTATVVDFEGVRAAVRFVRGDHLSLLVPSDFDDIDLAAAWQEMQVQTVDLVFNDGQGMTIVDESLLTDE